MDVMVERLRARFDAIELRERRVQADSNVSRSETARARAILDVLPELRLECDEAMNPPIKILNKPINTTGFGG
jgi:hypothetical protein